jgi:hypothetical protein
MKNIAVDKLCDIKNKKVKRVKAPHLGGKKTASKIKEWTKRWATTSRCKMIKSNVAAARRGSKTQKWMTRSTPQGDLSQITRPRAYNQLPRRKGILLAKARTNRWTLCNWFLNTIESSEAPSPLCETCKVPDDIRHVLDNCLQHEDARESMLSRLKYTGKVSDLLAAQDYHTINEVADLLITIDNDRTERLAKKREAAKESMKVKKSVTSGV